MKIRSDDGLMSGLAAELIKWYLANSRDLPWRINPTPYKVWLSEIILQQTRVNQGLPYYLRFVDRFVDIHHFAEAHLDEILKLWQGLGYYSRARNMHACAQQVVQKYGGSFPKDFLELQRLQGVGKYTAAAIASICFDQPVPVVDGNVYRVLSRLFGVDEDISNQKTYKIFFDLSAQLLEGCDPGVYNQAVMELGALVCSPKSPSCESCPIRMFCYAHSYSRQGDFPVKLKKPKVNNRSMDFLVYYSGEIVLLRQRSLNDIWAGLYEFCGVEDSKQLERASLHSTINHVLTHQRLHIRFYTRRCSDKELFQLAKNLSMIPVKKSELDRFAVPKPIESFLNSWDFV